MEDAINAFLEYLSIERNYSPSTIKAYEGDLIMFDNFIPEAIKQALQKIPREEFREKKIFFEASGGINEENYLEFAKTGVDVISMGCLTQRSKGMDFSMRTAKS